MSRRFPHPIPNGWFAVSWSHKLAPGEVKPIRYFGKNLVVFRTESGQPTVLDAHCVHLGAHLGHGGEVIGETIRCPFHGWRYDGRGRCVSIPYAKRIPRRAEIRSWDVVERNGMIMVWHHLEGKPPFYDAPALPEFEDPEWMPPRHFEFELRTCIQEMAENNADQAHFVYVHDAEKLTETTITYEGLIQKAVSTSSHETPFGTFESTLERVDFGLGLSTVRFAGIPGVGTLLLSSVAPIDEENVHARWALTVTRNAADTIGPLFIDGILEGVRQDFPIWENKIYRERPLLCDGDGPIGELRKWARQFYSQPNP